MERYKFPRTPHLPWSEGYTGDDVRLADISHFNGKKIVITEKLDGENISIYSDGYIHARSIDGIAHPSRDYLKNLMASKIYDIPEGWRICGEYLYAVHSIQYERLPYYFFIINIVNNQNVVMDWATTKYYADKLNLPLVPSIGEYECTPNWEKSLQKLTPRIMSMSSFGRTPEGYVIRTAGEFDCSEYDKNVAKYVRANHVQTDEHWTNNWVKAELYKE